MSRNPIWDFFVKVEGDAIKAECKTCGRNYSLGSDRPKLQTVTGLKSHLAKQHKNINAEYQRRAAERIRENARKMLKLDESAAVSEPKLVQSSLLQFKERKVAFPRIQNPSIVHYMTDSWIRYVIHSALWIFGFGRNNMLYSASVSFSAEFIKKSFLVGL